MITRTGRWDNCHTASHSASHPPNDGCKSPPCITGSADLLQFVSSSEKVFFDNRLDQTSAYSNT
jgi:hypothetical protein